MQISNVNPCNIYLSTANKQKSNIVFSASKTQENKQDAKQLTYHFFHILPSSKNKHIKLKAQDGEYIQAEVIKAKHNSWFVKHNEQCLGTILTSRCNAPIKGDNYPEYYKNKDYLFINSLSSHRTYKGIGTQLIKAVVEESKRLGLEGRVCLNASTTDASIGTPIPFYHKLGFQCSNSVQEKIVSECLSEGLPIPCKMESATMFLPQESIEKILNK